MEIQTGMNKNKKSADSADKVQTHLSALFYKGIGPYNIDIIIYIFINTIRYDSADTSLYTGK